MDSPQHVGCPERDRYHPDVLGEFVDRFHDVTAGVDEQGRYLGNIWHVIHTALVESSQPASNPWQHGLWWRCRGAAMLLTDFLSAKTDEERATMTGWAISPWPFGVRS